jgi:hypothetical protein
MPHELSGKTSDFFSGASSPIFYAFKNVSGIASIIRKTKIFIF